jgi:Na+/citrate or Na+/malate symporter
MIGFWIGGFFRGVEIANPSDNNLLVYTLIFLIIGVPVGLPCVTTTTMVGLSFGYPTEETFLTLTVPIVGGWRCLFGSA